MSISALVIICTIAVICYLIGLSAQKSAHFSPPHYSHATPAKRYPLLRKIAVQYNCFLGFIYLICSVFGILIFAYSHYLILLVVGGCLIALASVSLAVRVTWSYL